MTRRTRTVHEGPGYAIGVDDWIESAGPVGPGQGADLIAGALMWDAIESGTGSSAYIQLGCPGSKPILHPSCGRRALKVIRLILCAMAPHGQLIDDEGIARGTIRVHVAMPESATLRAIARARADRARIGRTVAFLRSRRKWTDAKAMSPHAETAA